MIHRNICFHFSVFIAVLPKMVYSGNPLFHDPWQCHWELQTEFVCKFITTLLSFHSHTTVL
jgi:hypothetical protein